MEEDNLYPNDSSYFSVREPEEQVRDRKKEKAKALQGQAMIKEIVSHLENRIDFYGSVDAMPEEVKLDANAFLLAHNANELTRDNLRSEKEYFESLLDTANEKE